MIRAKKWPHLTNTTDEMLLAWSKTSPLKKMQWLEEVRKLWGLALPKSKRKRLFRMIREDNR